MLYSECRITHLATIERQRVLPAPGQVLRRVGDHVTSNTVVAETDLTSGYRLIELEQALGTHISSASKVLVKKVGEMVEEGEVIARSGILIKTKCVSPVRGRILDARGSKVLIEAAPQHIQRMAFYPGQVTALIPERGVKIQIRGALVQGVWGTGEEVRTRLAVAVPDGDTTLIAESITPAHMGMILVGGRTLDHGAIERAVQNKVRAVIVGSASSSLLAALEASSLSVMLTEGFGDFAMNPDAFELLRSYGGQEACLNPAAAASRDGQRPEVIVPLSGAGGGDVVAIPGGVIEMGMRIRALRAPYENLVGEVVRLFPHGQRLESGIRAQGVEADLESVGRVFVPFENLEIIY
jgi:hypothetical protein